MEEFLEPSWQAAHPECGRIVAVDASGSEDDVFDRVVDTLARELPETLPAGGGSHLRGQHSVSR
jgi:hypothetical protein